MSVRPKHGRSGRRPSAVLSVLVVVPLTMTALPLASSAGAPLLARKALADLKVAKVTARPATLLAGQRLKVTDTTRNVGRRGSPRTRTRYYLSANQKHDRRDLLLGTRRVDALRRGARDTGSLRARIPTGTQARGWYVVACADATGTTREAAEGNNCRATGDRVTVTSPEPGPTFPMTPDPLTVGSTLQADRAVTQTAYNFEDTTIVATAEDGTTYTLLIPAGALVGPEEITMTPVASMSGLPLSGGLVAGVQLEPHGLQLLRPADLTISSPDAGPLTQQTAFLAHAHGRDFHLFPMAAPRTGDDSDVIRMTLGHFSTPGVGSGSPADRAAAAVRIPGRDQAQVEAAISETLRGERANQLNGGEPGPEAGEQVTTIMNRFHDQVVRPRMRAAETDERLAADAIALGLGWSRQMQLLGHENNPRHAEIMTSVEKILRNVLNQNWQDCLDHDVSATVDLLRVARTAALLGYAWQGEAGEKAFGCARFEIRFDSRITSSNSWSGNLQNGSSDGTWHTRGTVLTRLLEANSTGPLGWADFSYTMNNTITDPESTCHLSETGIGTAPGQLRAQATPLLGTLNFFEGAQTPPPVPVMASVSVAADAEPTETYRYSACDGSTSISTASRWSGHYEDVGKTWTTDPGQQVADFMDSNTFTIARSQPGSSRSEVTTVEVWHRPQV